MKRMSRVQEVFSKRKAYVGYLTAGDGGVDRSVSDFITLVESGVDILEIGIPCPNPFADGPVIRDANLRALTYGTTPETVLAIAREVRKKVDVPLVLLSYYQTLFKAGETYFSKAKAAGFDAVLIPDLPIEQEEIYAKTTQEAGLDLIFVISPLTSTERKKQIVSLSRSLIYYACRNGVTGVQEILPEKLIDTIASLKEMTSLPIVVGFGIGHQQTARAVLSEADGFVVGSAFVSLIENKADSAALANFVKSIDPR